MSQFSTPGSPPSRQHGEGTYQMLWDCRFCGTTKLLGVTHRHCPNCGAAQDPAWRYFPSEEEMVALANHKYVGVDKVCPACGQPNSAANTFCSECGADLSGAQTAQTLPDMELGTAGAAATGPRDVTLDNFQAEMQRVGAAPTAKTGLFGLRLNKWWMIVILAVVILLCAGSLFVIFYGKETTGEVTALTWERVIEIEVYGPVTISDWEGEAPLGAYGERNCRREQRSSERVAVGSHEECRNVDQGDGSFRRECRTVTDYESRPVYDTRCDYTIDTWTKAREVKASGDMNIAPQWPTYQLAAGSGAKNFGKERAGSQHEVYIVKVRDSGGDEVKCEFEDQAQWDKYRVGMKVTLKVGVLGNPHCDTLQPAP